MKSSCKVRKLFTHSLTDKFKCLPNVVFLSPWIPAAPLVIPSPCKDQTSWFAWALAETHVVFNHCISIHGNTIHNMFHSEIKHLAKSQSNPDIQVWTQELPPAYGPTPVHTQGTWNGFVLTPQLHLSRNLGQQAKGWILNGSFLMQKVFPS